MNLAPAPVNPYQPPEVDGGAPLVSPTALAKASPGQRLGAKIVDNILFFFVFFVGMLPGPLMSGLGALSEDAGLALAFAGLGLLSMGLIGYQWYLIATRGQTIGKQLLKIRIVRQDGSPVDFVTGVVVRNWPFTIGTQVIPFLGLIDALLIFGQDRRCLHDMLAKTDVVDASLSLP